MIGIIIAVASIAIVGNLIAEYLTKNLELGNGWSWILSFVLGYGGILLFLWYISGGVK